MTSEQPAADNPDQGQPPSVFAAIREVVVVLVLALGLSALMHSFVAQSNYVPSQSMMDTLQVNDKLLVSRITTRVTGVHRGEIVVFSDPGSQREGSNWVEAWPNPDGFAKTWRNLLVALHLADSKPQLVKRIVGVEGDHIVCCDDLGRISVNGVGLDEPYIRGARSDQMAFDVTVPKDSVFVMGDNRGDSRDSRFHLDHNSGAVPVKDVIGRVVMRIWPLNRVARLTIPTNFDAVPAAKSTPAPNASGTPRPTGAPMSSPVAP